MHTCISSHGLKRSWRSCPRRMNAGNKNTPSTHHAQRRNVTTLMVGLKNGHIRKNLTQSGEPQRYSWGMQKKQNKTNKLCKLMSLIITAGIRKTWMRNLHIISNSGNVLATLGGQTAILAGQTKVHQYINLCSSYGSKNEGTVCTI